MDRDARYRGVSNFVIMDQGFLALRWFPGILSPVDGAVMFWLPNLPTTSFSGAVFCSGQPAEWDDPAPRPESGPLDAFARHDGFRRPSSGTRVHSCSLKALTHVLTHVFTCVHLCSLVFM